MSGSDGRTGMDSWVPKIKDLAQARTQQRLFPRVLGTNQRFPPATIQSPNIGRFLRIKNTDPVLVGVKRESKKLVEQKMFIFMSRYLPKVQSAAEIPHPPPLIMKGFFLKTTIERHTVLLRCCAVY